MPLFCTVHKGDAHWIEGDTLNAMTEHAVHDRLYDEDNVRDVLRNHPWKVAFRMSRRDGRAIFFERVDLKIPR